MLFQLDKWQDIKWLKAARWKLAGLQIAIQAAPLLLLSLTSRPPVLWQWIFHPTMAVVFACICIHSVNKAIASQQQRIFNFLS